MYEIRVHCSNCNEETRIKIPDGKEIASQRCPTCSCKTLERGSMAKGTKL